MSNNKAEVPLEAINLEKIKALGNKERLRILQVLLKGPLSWTELQKELQMNPNSLNFHLMKLLHSELVLREVKESKEGRPTTIYSILPEGKGRYLAISGTSG